LQVGSAGVGTAAKTAERTKAGAGDGTAGGCPETCRPWVSVTDFSAFASFARYCQMMPVAWARPGCAGGSKDQPASAGVASIRIFSCRKVCRSIGIQYSITPKACQKFLGRTPPARSSLPPLLGKGHREGPSRRAIEKGHREGPSRRVIGPLLNPHPNREGWRALANRGG